MIDYFFKNQLRIRSVINVKFHRFIPHQTCISPKVAFMQCHNISNYVRDKNGNTKFKTNNPASIEEVKTFGKKLSQKKKSCSFTEFNQNSDIFKSEIDSSDIFGTLTENNLLSASSTFDSIDYDDEEDIEHKELLESYRRMKNTPSWYAIQCKNLAKQGKLKNALELFEIQMLKVDGIKPIQFNYTVLIRACGLVGYSKKAFSLFNQMKKRNISANTIHYTYLFFACANSVKKEELSVAHKLLSQMEEKNIKPTIVTYHAMIKAFGRLGDIETAFKILDKMVKSKIYPTIYTFNFLLHACISDQEMGFKLAIEVWRKMIIKKIKPNIYTYNLFLKALKDCGIGDASFSNELIRKNIRPNYVEFTLFKKEKRSSKVLTYGDISVSDDVSKNSELVVLPEEKKIPNILDPFEDFSDIISLNDINSSLDRFCLLGGLNTFLNLMSRDEVQPDIKTFSMLLEIIPSTIDEEEKLLDIMKKYHIQVDVDFINMLIKKRNFRNDFENSKSALTILRDYHVYPNVMTFGCLSLGCKSWKDASQLIKDMEEINFSPNIEILGTLVRQATLRYNFWYLIDICKETKRLQLKPNEKFIQHIEKCIASTKENILNYSKACNHNLKENSLFTNDKFLHSFAVFQKYYKNWLKSMDLEIPEDHWTAFQYVPKTAKSIKEDFSFKSEIK